MPAMLRSSSAPRLLCSVELAGDHPPDQCASAQRPKDHLGGGMGLMANLYGSVTGGSGRVT